jgi:polyhydroxyalkanoate synthesis regulator phasin
MTETALTSTQPSSFWSRVWNFLRALDEAIHTTEMDLLAERVERLERQLGELKAESANSPAAIGGRS